MTSQGSRDSLIKVNSSYDQIGSSQSRAIYGTLPLPETDQDLRDVMRLKVDGPGVIKGSKCRRKIDVPLPLLKAKRGKQSKDGEDDEW